MVRVSLGMITALAASSMTGFSLAHPGENVHASHIKREVDNLIEANYHAKRALDGCQGGIQSRALMARAHERRAKIVADLRRKRGIANSELAVPFVLQYKNIWVRRLTVCSEPQKYRRDLATLQEFETVNHNMTGLVSYTPETDPSVIFAGNTTCLLAPDITDGPYYVIGENIRSNLLEDGSVTAGVPMYVEAQYVDVNTCLPVPQVAVDYWSCNATGVYSGVVDAGMAGLNTSFLRGIQITDEDGVVGFETIFPGHYSGRAIHSHLTSHNNVTILPNNTITGGRVSHIGQLFYPDDLRADVEANYPYNTNTVALTTNDEDQWAPVQTDTYYDPFVDFVYLGSDITDGLFVWKQIAINTTVDYTDDDNYKIASIWTANGGVENTDPDTMFTGGA